MKPLMAVFILELHIRSYPFASLQEQSEIYFSRVPTRGIHSGISLEQYLAESRFVHPRSSKVVSGQYQLQYIFIQKAWIHLLSKSGFGSLETPDKKTPKNLTTLSSRESVFFTSENSVWFSQVPRINSFTLFTWPTNWKSTGGRQT